MESLPLASCPKHIPDGVGDCPLGGSGPAAFRAYSLPWLGQVFLEFPPQWPRHPEVVHFRRCGSLSHKAHLLSRMVMVAIPFSERCVFVQGSQGSSRIESKCIGYRAESISDVSTPFSRSGSSRRPMRGGQQTEGVVRASVEHRIRVFGLQILEDALGSIERGVHPHLPLFGDTVLEPRNVLYVHRSFLLGGAPLTLYIQDHPSLPTIVAGCHVEPVERRALYLPLPAVAFEVEWDAEKTCFERQSFLAVLPDPELRPGWDKTLLLHEEDKLVDPAHQEGLTVGARQPHEALSLPSLRRLLQQRHEQRLAGLVEQSLERWSLQLEADVRRVVQYPDHRVSEASRLTTRAWRIPQPSHTSWVPGIPEGWLSVVLGHPSAMRPV